MSEVIPRTTYSFIRKPVPTFYFIGVTTRQSSIMRLFPLWMNELGFPEVTLEGVDLKLDDEPEHYREVVGQIKGDPQSLGALVTTHKINLLSAAHDMFDYLDPYAAILHEISSISKRDDRLEGHAKDPVSAGKTLDALLGKAYFASTKGDVLCLGAGGAGTAISLHLCNQPEAGDRPARIVVTDTAQARLDHLQAMIRQVNPGIAFEFVLTDAPEQADTLMATLPPHSVVINATGLGKDRPGSPITDASIFPRNAIVWELNYRGALDFMYQALRQQDSRKLRVEDGWVYFLHGWTQVIEQVLHTPIDSERFERLAEIARQIR
ncbi:MAG: shikimate dehydrogenase [Anaerolineae bacterium]|nr:shikimate dehydrogenase [Anaerolineae bacterium]